MNRTQLRTFLERYRPASQLENSFISPFLELLDHPNAYNRNHLPGHFTASGWITTPDLAQVVLVHHRKLNRWLQPGGHADGIEDLHAVACKEVLEETGLKPKEGLPFDLDIHTIPANNKMPEHLHFDVRFHFILPYQPLVCSEESNDLKWVPCNEVASIVQDEPGIIRMLTKLQR